MKSSDVRAKYLAFFVKRGHKEIPSASLVPENDPTTLFTSSGMQPLIPYLLGQLHPLGKRLVNSQKSFRAQDIDEVGDNRHTTFFEMLGNWSLGDPDAKDGIGAGYFKKEQLPWIFEFLTKDLSLDPERLFVSVFEGNESVPKDTESIGIWKEIFAGVGIDAKVAEPSFAKATEGARIFLYDARKNWWSRSGEPEKMPPGEPGGPDSEVFFDFGEELGIHEKSPFKNQKCHPNCECGRFLEIANSVFMQYQKPPFAEASSSAEATEDRSGGRDDGNKLIELKQKNVDFGGGLERMTAATENNPDIFTIDMFSSIIRIIELNSGKKYGENVEQTKAIRIIADHMRASVFMVSDGVIPSNQKQGYVLRRLLRRAIVVFARLCDTDVKDFLDSYKLKEIIPAVLHPYVSAYPETVSREKLINSVIEEEWYRFKRNMHTAYPEVMKLMNSLNKNISGKDAFYLLETHGILPVVLEEVAKKFGKMVDWDTFKELQKKHQQLSQSAAAGMFKGGLADRGEETTKLHTAHHLLLAALQKLVDPTIKQRGSNITAERLRMDFNFARKLTPEEIKKVEELVNRKITEDLPVTRVVMDREKAEKIGAQMEFGQKYPDKVSVYFVGDQNNFYSAEFCGGPHVTHTGEIGTFKILKEESSGSGIRRIYAAVKKMA